MPCIKQKTVSAGEESQTIKLMRRSNKRGNSQYRYAIEDADTGERFGDEYTRKGEAKSAFDQVVADIRRGMQSAGGTDRRGPLPW